MSQDREPLPSRVEGLPELPSEALTLLDEGLVGLRLGDLSGPVRRGLVDHLRLLLAWNQAINLSAIRDPVAAVREHILDSLSAVHVLRERAIEGLLDLGSGGGYPGLPLALAVPARRSLLVESVGKKAAFLSAAATLLTVDGGPAGVEIDVYNGRAEALAADGRHRERWPAVVARAIAPLAELAEIGLPLVAPGGILLAWKRRPFEAELLAAEPALELLGGGAARVLPVSVAGLDDHLLVVIEKVGPAPAAYPRDPAQRRRQPLAGGKPLPSP
ncbi:MAG TPA: 16S rRNA (guanine(527)-N(7))-methyltransferase RsmG [Candidatus Limnocylindrales bacterium]|nr:16S rRNA (guanine(527)-N(7))-methyltransferase RsmG [Candidatus Limnocylindrales bacterium]